MFCGQMVFQKEHKGFLNKFYFFSPKLTVTRILIILIPFHINFDEQVDMINKMF
jgi:hypothetical protein